MRASDADRDAVVSDLSEHFQAGRLTAEELDERTGRALTARTYAELREITRDLPALRTRTQTPAPGTEDSPAPRPSGHPAPLVAALTGIAIAVVVLVALHSGFGLIWLLVPALIFARRSCYRGHYSQRN
jgi:hypothetical protein